MYTKFIQLVKKYICYNFLNNKSKAGSLNIDDKNYNGFILVKRVIFFDLSWGIYIKSLKKLKLEVNTLLVYFQRVDFCEFREHKFTMVSPQDESKCRGLSQMVLDCTEMDRAQEWMLSDVNPNSMAHICCHGEGFLLQCGLIQPCKVILHVLLQVFAQQKCKICPTTCQWFYSWTNEEPSTVGKEPNSTISCFAHGPIFLWYPHTLFTLH